MSTSFINLFKVPVLLAATCASVALPPQSRFASGDENRISDIVNKELGPVKAELEKIKSKLSRSSIDATDDEPQFRQINPDDNDDETRKHHKEKWKNAGVPPHLIKSLEELVDAFKKKPPSGGPNKPYVDPALAAATSPDKVADMITYALEHGPPVRPDLMQEMFDKWHAQGDAMNYLQQTKPDWIKSSLPPQPYNVVPVTPFQQQPVMMTQQPVVQQPMMQQQSVLQQPVMQQPMIVQQPMMMAPPSNLGIMTSLQPSAFTTSLLSTPR